jgi:hypothetical protein
VQFFKNELNKNNTTPLDKKIFIEIIEDKLINNAVLIYLKQDFLKNQFNLILLCYIEIFYKMSEKKIYSQTDIIDF